MVTYIAPTRKSFFINGAFRIDDKLVGRIQSLVRPFIGDPLGTTFILQMKDSTKHQTESIEELEQLPLHHKRTRDTFEIECSREGDEPWNGPQATFTWHFDGPTPTLYVSLRHPTRIAELAQVTADFFKQERPWYSIFFPPWAFFVESGLIGCMMGTILASGVLHGVSHVSPSELALVLVLSFLYFFFSSREFIFGRVVVVFGAERQRQENRKAFWQFLVTGVLFASIAATVGGAASGYFANILGLSR